MVLYPVDIYIYEYILLLFPKLESKVKDGCQERRHKSSAPENEVKVSLLGGNFFRRGNFAFLERQRECGCAERGGCWQRRRRLLLFLNHDKRGSRRCLHGRRHHEQRPASIRLRRGNNGESPSSDNKEEKECDRLDHDGWKETNQWKKV